MHRHVLDLMKVFSIWLTGLFGKLRSPLNNYTGIFVNGRVRQNEGFLVLKVTVY